MLKKKKSANNLEQIAQDERKIVSKRRKLLGLFLPIIPLAIGIYILSLVFAPKLVPYINSGKVSSAINEGSPELGDDRVYIQKLGVNVGLKSGGAEAMNGGNAWHRFPERGDPEVGGNFIISAHRWIRGSTPQETAQQSPFYNTDQLGVGDAIVVDFEGKRYKYEIYEIGQVKPDQTEIEEPIEEYENARMTLYTCTLKGATDGRVVVYARLVKL